MERQEARLSNRIFHALELALDQNDLAIADLLGRALEESLTRFGGPGAVERRDVSDAMLEALVRLDQMRKRAVRGF